MNNQRRSHNRIVLECYMAIKKASDENDSDKLLKVMSRYGKKTRDDAIQMMREEHAKDMGMTVEEYEKWLNED